MSTLSARIDLPPTPRSVVAARRVVREALGAWGAPHDRADAELLATELVANVVDHVGGEVSFGLEVTLSDRWLRIAVADGSAVRPVVQELSGDRPRGRGMQLVAAIADCWGVEDRDGGKVVWLELSPHAAGDLRSLAAGRCGDGSGDRDRRTKESSR
jgi:anti-sigma regulatory factor (Ser/Thr protein kinase)